MGFSLNLTNEEMSAEVKAYEAAPAGEYHVTITDGELKEVSESNTKGNAGKPYAALTLTIQEPEEHAGKKIFTNVMLFSGPSSFMVAQLIKAVDHPEWATDMPDDFLEEIDGVDIVAVVSKKKDDYKMKENGDGKIVFKNEIRGFKPYGEDGDIAMPGKAGKNPLLP